MGLTGFLFVIGKEEECENYKNEQECINSNCEWREKDKICKQKIICFRNFQKHIFINTLYIIELNLTCFECFSQQSGAL